MIPFIFLLASCSVTIEMAPKQMQPEKDLFKEINEDTRFANINTNSEIAEL